MKNIEYILNLNFICPRCKCTHYDKIICTNDKTINNLDNNYEGYYVCRNCNLKINIGGYQNDKNKNSTVGSNK